MHQFDPDQPHLSVTITDGITLDELVSRIQAARGKPLRIEELSELADTDTALCGLWLATEGEDIILHAPSDSVLHREQFILHELSHMLLLHDRVDGRSGYVTAAVLPDFDSATIIKSLARDDIDDEYEIQAEHLADVIATHMRRRPFSRFSVTFG